MMTLIQGKNLKLRTNVRWCVSVCLGVFLSCGIARAQMESNHGLGESGYVVIEAARDSASGFVWEEGPGPGFRSLIWPEGRLTVPDSLLVEDFGRRDLGLRCAESLAGSGSSGQLVFRDGIFPVSEPVVLTDGFLELQVTGGELEIRGAMIRYRRSDTRSGDFRSGLLLMAGMTLMIIVLLRRARIKSNQRPGL